MPNNPAPLAARDERAYIVAAAQDLYLRQRVATVAPEDVAASLKLSANTVRKWFATSELLAHAVVDALADQFYAELSRLKEQSPTAIAELAALASWTQQQGSHAAFFRQLQESYPTAWHRWQDHLEFFLLLHLRNNLRWGIMQELYQDTLQEEIMARRWFQILLTDEPAAEPAPHTLLLELLAEVATPAGFRAVQDLPAERDVDKYPIQ